MKIAYPAFLEYDAQDNSYLVTFPDLVEAITDGVNKEEALFNAQEVLTLTLEARIDEKLEIPEPSTLEGAVLVMPSSRVQAAILIRQAKKGHSTAEIARLLETSWPSASRLEDPHHWPSLRQLDKFAHAVGQRLVLSFEPIA